MKNSEAASLSNEVWSKSLTLTEDMATDNHNIMHDYFVNLDLVDVIMSLSAI